MRKRDNRLVRLTVSALLVASNIWLVPGCATLAHRNSHSKPGKTSATACAADGAVCPWLVGDALLLIPGVVPGVIAFIVDFGTGAWRHEGLELTADSTVNAPTGATASATAQQQPGESAAAP